MRAEKGSKRERGTAEYVKEAFLFRWNLLALAGGVGAALISPIAPILLPLVGAAELVYLTGLVSLPRFRSVVDRKLHERERAASSPAAAKTDPEAALRELLARLAPEQRRRFDALRARCLDMRSIAHGVSGRAAAATPVDEVANPGLDKLLWVFLRLLVSQNSLDRFLETTDEPTIHAQAEDLRKRLAELGEPGDERLRRSLVDALATAELRVDNFEKARDNERFVTVELERLEAKIRTLAEMAINRQDPDFISREVDSVTESISHTEAAMNELRLVTGLIEDLDQPPAILGGDLGAKERA